jgi:hypothetical protein
MELAAAPAKDANFSVSLILQLRKGIAETYSLARPYPQRKNQRRCRCCYKSTLKGKIKIVAGTVVRSRSKRTWHKLLSL